MSTIKFAVFAFCVLNLVFFAWDYLQNLSNIWQLVNEKLCSHPNNSLNHVYTVYLCILAKYPHYDGIIWPELQRELESSSDGTLTKAVTGAWRWFTGSKPKESNATAAVSTFEQNFLNIKSLQPNEHKEYRIKALKMYLEILKDKLTVQETRNDPVQFVRMIYAIYDSLNSRFVFYDELEYPWKFDEVAKVRKECIKKHIPVCC